MANLGSIAVKYAPDGANPNLQVDLILQEALDTFTKDLGILGSIHRDFGGEAMRFNQSLQTRIFSTRAKTDVVDWLAAKGGVATTAASYNGGNEDQDADAVAIKLDKHKFIKFHLTDLEREQTMVQYVSEAAKYAAHALAQKVTEDLLEEAFLHDTVVNGVQIAQAAFDIDNLYDVAKAMDDLNMPKTGRWMVLDHTAYYLLLKTLTTVSNASYDIKPGINRAFLDQNLAGFKIYTYNGMAGLTNGAKVLAGYEGSLAMVNRLPEFADASMQIGDIANASEPNSGLSLQLRRKYDVFASKEEYALTCMYGLKAPNDYVPAVAGGAAATGNKRLFTLNIA
jgi:hypothetical protein